MKKNHLNHIFSCLSVALAGAGCGHRETAIDEAVYEINNNNPELALPVLEREAANGSRRAKVILAKVYAAGIGVPADIKKAQTYLLCEGEPKCTSGEDEYYLGVEIRDGVGVQKNEENGLLLIQRSTELGFKPKQ